MRRPGGASALHEGLTNGRANASACSSRDIVEEVTERGRIESRACIQFRHDLLQIGEQGINRFAKSFLRAAYRDSTLNLVVRIPKWKCDTDHVRSRFALIARMALHANLPN